MLHIKRFIFNPFGENTYLIWSDHNNAAIIDPGMMSDYENDTVAKFIKDNNLNLQRLINTHAHIDHMAGNGFIEKNYTLTPEYNEADNYLAEHLKEQAKMFGIPFTGDDIISMKNLADNQTIKIDELELHIIHIPGHTKGHICIYSAQDASLFSGDALFRMSIGRTDLPGGNYNELINSITSRIMPLPGATIIYPGHGETTTVEFERAHNPYL